MRPILTEPFRTYNRPLKPKSSAKELDVQAVKEASFIEDESLDSFLSRRFGEDFARIFGSALVHGIYACDSKELSVKTAFPGLWKVEERGMGSVVMGYLRDAFIGTGKESETGEGHELGTVEGQMQGVSVFSFRRGIEEISKALKEWLSRRQSVQIRTSTEARSIRFDSHSKTFQVHTISRREI
jgi:oxygen-dependent protoporphyrinogen oxidase